MRLAAQLLLMLNRFAPRPNFPVRKTPGAYAEWEFREAEYQLRLMEASGVSIAGLRVLDVGCGMGGKSAYLAGRGAASILGVDLLVTNVCTARAFAAARGVRNVEFAAGDATHLPVREGSFDLVITTDTFEHFAEPEAALAEMTRALRSGGRLVAVFGPFGSPLGSHLYDVIFVPWCHVIFSRNSLAEAVREIARRRAAFLGPDNRADELKKAEDQIVYYDSELNHMTLRRFAQIVRAEPGLRLLAWNRWTPPKLRRLSYLLRVPGLDELLTGLLVMVAEREK
jgi:ubiquinone/menaquinone biosynthesis C-methylase UbiE